MGRPVEPPPYEEVAAAGHVPGRVDEPPPPYVSRENLNQQSGSSEAAAGQHWSSRNPGGSSPFLSAIFSLLVNNSQPLVPPPTGQHQPSVVIPVPVPAAVERVEEDNNNGDINGNNTGQVWVRPNSNRNQALPQAEQPIPAEDDQANDEAQTNPPDPPPPGTPPH